MTDATFERRLARYLRDLADSSPRPFDPHAIAVTVVAGSSRRSWLPRPFARRRPVATTWRTRLVVAWAVVGLLLLGLAIGGFVGAPRATLAPTASLRPTFVPGGFVPSACGLLTPAEIEAATGLTVGAGTSDGSALGGADCSWVTPGARTWTVWLTLFRYEPDAWEALVGDTGNAASTTVPRDPGSIDIRSNDFIAELQVFIAEPPVGSPGLETPGSSGRSDAAAAGLSTLVLGRLAGLATFAPPAPPSVLIGTWQVQPGPGVPDTPYPFIRISASTWEASSRLDFATASHGYLRIQGDTFTLLQCGVGTTAFRWQPISDGVILTDSIGSAQCQNTSELVMATLFAR